MIKVGDYTIVGERALNSRVVNREAEFAMNMIEKWGLYHGDKQPGAVVERAFAIAALTFQHIKENRMDSPFPFKKVYGDGEEDTSGS
jgi:hypothetical protein